MEIEEYGRAKILMPSIEDDELTGVDDLEDAESLADFEYADRSVRHLVVADTTLSAGRLRRIEAGRMTFSQVAYATFDTVHASTPVAFVGTRFKEVTFRRTDLPAGHMSGCTLHGVQFDGGNYAEFDFRGNDLSTVLGAGNLGGILIDPVQRQEIAEALVSELELRYVDEAER